MSREFRSVAFEVKAVEAEHPMSFEGYGSVFNTVDSYADTIVKGAFKGTLREWKTKGKLPKMLLQHGGGGFSQNADDLVPIGKWDEMREDDHGLYVRGHLFDLDTDRAKATYRAMKEGEMDGLSIGFQTRKFKMDQETGIRSLTDINLWEVSPVTFPANEPALISDVRSAGDLPTEREFERWLARTGGFSAREVEAIVSKGYRLLKRGGSMPAHEACEELRLLKKHAAILSGAEHGTRSEGADRSDRA